MFKLKKHPVIVSLLLITFFSLLAYVPLIPFLGFYSEDFFFSYAGHFYGIEGLIKSLIIDRPFNGYLLAFFYSLLGDNVFFWHVNTFLTRLFGGYVLFFLLLKNWPNRLSTITFITLLFLIYPGFLQQTLPLGYQVHVVSLTVWFTSLMFTLLSIKTANKFKLFLYSLLALVTQMFTLFNLEFFIGMEVFRLLMITYILKREISLKAIRKTITYWGLYILGVVIFILWRIFLFKSTRNETDINWVLQTYYSNFDWVLKFPLEVIHSLLQTVIFAYFLPTAINFIRLPWQNSTIALTVGLISTVIFYIYNKSFKTEDNYKIFGKNLFIIGLISLLGTIIPLIALGRIVRVFSAYDRYTIPGIIGVSFLIVGFLLFKFPYRIRSLILISLVALSITSHLMNGFYRADYWNKQKDLWWQLYWRAPKIEKNAMLILDFPPITENIPFKEIINKVHWYRFYWAEEQIWTAGNLFFNYNNPPINHFYGDFLADSGIAEKIKEGSAETFNNRNIIYTRDFKNSIITTAPSDVSCLKILDGDKLIKTGLSVTPPKHIFGNEPPHTWCYYFQKASLARQLKDWNKLSQLKEEVLQKNLKPKDPNEWLPFTQNLR